MLCSIKDAFYKPSSILTDFLEKQNKTDLAVSKYYNDTKNINSDFEKNLDKKNESKIIINDGLKNNTQNLNEIITNDLVNEILENISKKNKQNMNMIDCKDVAYHLSICKLCNQYIKNNRKEKNILDLHNIFNLNNNDSFFKIILYIVIIIVIYKILMK
jgi:hypothetical protein